VQGGTEAALYLVAQLAGRRHLRATQALAHEGQDLCGQLARPLGTRLLRQQSRGPFAQELRLQAVEGLAADSVALADRADGVALDQMSAQHLVADLQVVLDVEELRCLLEQRIADALGVRVQQAGLPKLLSLVGLGVGHRRQGSDGHS